MRQLFKFKYFFRIWSFFPADFATILSKKIGIEKSILNDCLWGDFWLDVKNKTLKPNAYDRGKPPVFANAVLENLWSVYDAVVVQKDEAKTKKICDSVGVTLSGKLVIRRWQKSASRKSATEWAMGK